MCKSNVGLAVAIILLTMDQKCWYCSWISYVYGTNAVVIFIFGTLFRLCRFIQNNDDEINHKYYLGLQNYVYV